MSLPQVVPRLTGHGLRVDCCAWYPWLHDEYGHDGYYLGMDSCAAFYIGGSVSCKLRWDFDSIEEFLREAQCDPRERPRSRHDGAQFDTYSGNNVPDQIWNRYKNKVKEKGSVGLRERSSSAF